MKIITHEGQEYILKSEVDGIVRERLSKVAEGKRMAEGKVSELEAKAQRENIIALLDKNLIGPVDAIMKLYPDITTEEQAVEKLRTIRQQKIEFA